MSALPGLSAVSRSSLKVNATSPIQGTFFWASSVMFNVGEGIFLLLWKAYML